MHLRLGTEEKGVILFKYKEEQMKRKLKKLFRCEKVRYDGSAGLLMNVRGQLRGNPERSD